MILTGSEIKKAIRKGSITITPFSAGLLNPNSYNYRLGNLLTEVTDAVVDAKIRQSLQRITIPEEGYVLQPGKLYLGHTLETIGSADYVVSLIGRSSVGRLGLFLQITADLGQLGKAHRWTLEMKVVQPLRIYPGMRIGQLSFWKPSGATPELYQNGYASFNQPQLSMLYERLQV